MAKVNEDGNTLGRVSALLTLALTVFYVGRIACGPDSCPFAAGKTSGCAVSSK